MTVYYIDQPQKKNQWNAFLREYHEWLHNKFQHNYESIDELMDRWPAYKGTLADKYPTMRTLYFNSDCQMTYKDAKYCNKPYCTIHGCNNRYKAWLQYVPPYNPDLAYTIVGNHLDFLIHPDDVKLAIKMYERGLKKNIKEGGWIWRLHFIDKIPHLAALIHSNTYLTSDSNKYLWTNILKSLNHPSPTQSDTHASPMLDYQGWTKYMYQCTDHLPINQTPPKLGKKKRWTYHGERAFGA